MATQEEKDAKKAAKEAEKQAKAEAKAAEKAEKEAAKAAESDDSDEVELVAGCPKSIGKSPVKWLLNPENGNVCQATELLLKNENLVPISEEEAKAAQASRDIEHKLAVEARKNG